MTTMIAEVYDALLQAGAGEEKSRRAAEALAGHEDRFTRLEHKIDDVDRKIDRVEHTLSRRIDEVETKLTHRFDAFEAGVDHRFEAFAAAVDHRFEALDVKLSSKIDGVDARLRSEQLVMRWMLGTLMTLVVAIALKIFLH